MKFEGREKEENDPFFPHFSSCRTKENGNGEEENMRFQGHEKEKDLAYLSIEKV